METIIDNDVIRPLVLESLSTFETFNLASTCKAFYHRLWSGAGLACLRSLNVRLRSPEKGQLFCHFLASMNAVLLDELCIWMDVNEDINFPDGFAGFPTLSKVRRLYLCLQQALDVPCDDLLELLAECLPQLDLLSVQVSVDRGYVTAMPEAWTGLRHLEVRLAEGRHCRWRGSGCDELAHVLKALNHLVTLRLCGYTCCECRSVIQSTVWRCSDTLQALTLPERMTLDLSMALGLRDVDANWESFLSLDTSSCSHRNPGALAAANRQCLRVAAVSNVEWTEFVNLGLRSSHIQDVTLRESLNQQFTPGFIGYIAQWFPMLTRVHICLTRTRRGASTKKQLSPEDVDGLKGMGRLQYLKLCNFDLDHLELEECLAHVKHLDLNWP